ncbi:MAG: deoxyribodipyrimidine photo-lyase [Burkholderiales bacterium]|nr:deoxyribodipyrimidine photo-lyase [Burkholderiales bacterium]
MEHDSALFWFRRDLRQVDNAGLARARAAARRVYCIFVFDRAILEQLPSPSDRRVEFIRDSVIALAEDLGAAGGALVVVHDDARSAIPRLARDLQVGAVFANHDYEPQAIARDAVVATALERLGIAWHSSKDQVIFERDEIMTGEGRFFSVFTPYKRAWLKRLTARDLAPHAVPDMAGLLTPPPPSAPTRVPTLEELGFRGTNLAALGVTGGAAGAQKLFADFAPRMVRYADARDYPAVKGPSYLSVHLRFGTVSIRSLARAAWESWQSGVGGNGAATWLSELIWRDFYFQILANNPHVVDRPFRAEYESLRWEEGEQADALFDAWANGRTGYPLVDAAMRQILSSGYMHNRLRMVVASFLTKDLGIDWRRGERFFADHLIDFDLAANNGGWQWAASTGCDAQPYFRIFNPVTQSERFDPEGAFIRRYVPELADLPAKAIHAPWLVPPSTLTAAGVRLGEDYPLPVVDHALARERTLARFKVARGR